MYWKTLRAHRQTRRSRRALNADWKLRCATDLDQSFTVALHLAIISEPRQCVFQDASCILIWWFDDAVVHPGALAPRSNDSRSTQVSQMAADLWLVCFQNLHEETNAYFILAHEMKQSQARSVRQCPKE